MKELNRRKKKEKIIYFKLIIMKLNIYQGKFAIRIVIIQLPSFIDMKSNIIIGQLETERNSRNSKTLFLISLHS